MELRDKCTKHKFVHLLTATLKDSSGELKALPRPPLWNSGVAPLRDGRESNLGANVSRKNSGKVF